MGTFPVSIEKTLEVWNTSEPTKKAELVEAALEHNIHFVDPNYNIVGRKEFLDMVAEVQNRIPGAVYSHASSIDTHNNHCRYHWAIHRDGSLLMEGFDVTEVNDGGKIVKITGFFGELKR